MNKVLLAIKFANLKHKGQIRKVSGEEYITHPIKVSYILAAFKKSKKLEDLICASLLHDTLEDTETSFEELNKHFGPLVASLVFELSNDNEEIKKIGKRDYQLNKMRGMSSYALVIKLADRLANITDNPTEKMKEDTLYILKELSKKRKLSKTHLAIISEIRNYLQ
jgi:(p)ppGpp synthase/HD superfamily hydrolase